MEARQLAFEVLKKIEVSGAYANLELDARLGELSDRRESAFVAALVYGVVERKLTLDYILSRFYQGNAEKLKPHVKTVLRMGLYQIYYMEKIPPSAAVNESVKLARKNGASHASGLVNALLRRAARTPLEIERGEDETAYYSILYSCPPWLVEHFFRCYGEEKGKAILESFQTRPPLTVRVNTLKTTPGQLVERLRAEGVTVRRPEEEENALMLEDAGRVEGLSAFQEGLFHVQDLSSQRCCALVDPQPGEVVLDLCCAPGGKSFTMAQQMQNRGRLLAFDQSSSRLKLVEEMANRLGISLLYIAQNDASVFSPAIPQADRVLCDVPCSGLGVIGKKPEIRYKKQEDIDKLPQLQYLILDTSSRYVKEGGRLVYSTCTLHPAENEEVCEKFLQNAPSFRLLSSTTLLPDPKGGDGFFVAVMERGEEGGRSREDE